MTKFVIALILVFAILAGGLLAAVLRGRRLPTPPQDVLDRVAQRNRELDAQERAERGE